MPRTLCRNEADEQRSLVSEYPNNAIRPLVCSHSCQPLTVPSEKKMSGCSQEKPCWKLLSDMKTGRRTPWRHPVHRRSRETICSGWEWWGQQVFKTRRFQLLSHELSESVETQAEINVRFVRSMSSIAISIHFLGRQIAGFSWLHPQAEIFVTRSWRLGTTPKNGSWTPRDPAVGPADGSLSWGHWIHWTQSSFTSMPFNASACLTGSEQPTETSKMCFKRQRTNAHLKSVSLEHLRNSSCTAKWWHSNVSSRPRHIMGMSPKFATYIETWFSASPAKSASGTRWSAKEWILNDFEGPGFFSLRKMMTFLEFCIQHCCGRKRMHLSFKFNLRCWRKPHRNPSRQKSDSTSARGALWFQTRICHRNTSEILFSPGFEVIWAAGASHTVISPTSVLETQNWTANTTEIASTFSLPQ